MQQFYRKTSLNFAQKLRKSSEKPKAGFFRLFENSRLGIFQNDLKDVIWKLNFASNFHMNKVRDHVETLMLDVYK